MQSSNFPFHSKGDGIAVSVATFMTEVKVSISQVLRHFESDSSTVERGRAQISNFVVKFRSERNSTFTVNIKIGAIKTDIVSSSGIGRG